MSKKEVVTDLETFKNVVEQITKIKTFDDLVHVEEETTRAFKLGKLTYEDNCTLYKLINKYRIRAEWERVSRK